MNEKEPNPEQLLKMLDAQLQASRALRDKKSGNRAAFRVLAIMIVLILLMGSLWLLMFMAQEAKDAVQRGGKIETSSQQSNNR